MKLIPILALTATLGLAHDAGAAEPMPPSGVAQALMSNSDKDFFESAASAGLFEVQSGQLAATKATDPKLKAFGEKMVKDHTEANQELAMLAGKKKVTLPTTLLKRHQQFLDDLNEDEPGKDFDEDYRNKMVLTHKEAVSLFDQAAKKSKDPEIKAFAAKTLPKLQAHGGLANELNKH